MAKALREFRDGTGSDYDWAGAMSVAQSFFDLEDIAIQVTRRKRR